MQSGFPTDGDSLPLDRMDNELPEGRCLPPDLVEQSPSDSIAPGLRPHLQAQRSSRSRDGSMRENDDESEDEYESDSDDVSEYQAEIDDEVTATPWVGGKLQFWIYCATWCFGFGAFVALGLFAMFGPIAAVENGLSSATMQTAISVLSNALALSLASMFSAMLDKLRWMWAIHDGTAFTTFFGLSPGTGILGKVSLLFSRHIHRSTRLYMLMALFCFASHFLLSVMLTIRMEQLPLYWGVVGNNSTYNGLYMVAGMGPFCPYDLAGIVFSGPSLGDRIALKYDGFTQNAAQMYPFTSNLTNIRSICKIGCFAYLMPGSANMALVPTRDNFTDLPSLTNLCDAEHPTSCLTPPYLMTPNNWTTLSECDPANRTCVGDVVLAAQDSWYTALSYKRQTNFTPWSDAGADRFEMLNASAYVIYFDPLPDPGPHPALLMDQCRNYTSNGYAINACMAGKGSSSFAVGWSVCEPITTGCNASEAGWMTDLPWSTVMTVEGHRTDTYQIWPEGGIEVVLNLSPPTQLDIPTNQFFDIFTSAFENAPALESIVYDIAVSTDITAGTGDIRQMRDLLSYALYVSTTQLLVGPSADLDVDSNSPGIVTAEFARALGLFACVPFYMTVIFLALGVPTFTIGFLPPIFYFRRWRRTPNGTSFPELNTAARIRDTRLLEGMSEATDEKVVKEFGTVRIFFGRNEDGPGVEISTSRRRRPRKYW